jgi:hypothetical protein
VERAIFDRLKVGDANARFRRHLRQRQAFGFARGAQLLAHTGRRCVGGIRHIALNFVSHHCSSRLRPREPAFPKA